MGDRVDTLEIGGRELSDISIDCRDPAAFVYPKGAILVQLSIDAHHLMTGRLQPVDERAADVAPMSGYQYPHLIYSHIFQGALPSVQSSSSNRFSRRVSIHCQNELWRYAMSCLSAASRTIDSLSQLVASLSMYSNTPGSKTKKAPLIHPSPSAGFSRKQLTWSPSSAI